MRRPAAWKGWKWIGEAERRAVGVKYWAWVEVVRRAVRVARVVVGFIVVVFLGFGLVLVWTGVWSVVGSDCRRME